MRHAVTQKAPFGKGVACDMLSLKRLPLVKVLPVGETSQSDRGGAASGEEAPAGAGEGLY